MKLKHIIYSLLVLVLAGMIFYRIRTNQEKEAGGPGGGPGKGKGKGGGGPAKVSGVVIAPEVFANALSVSGSIEGNEQVDIRSQLSGIVTDIYFNEGTDVSQGQSLVKIDDAELRASLEQAETRQALAAESERRARLLLEKQAISSEEYDVASADYKALKAQTQLIRAQLAKTVIKAPFSGRIGLRSVSRGQFISPEVVITRLVNLDPVKITFSVPEKYSGQVKVNTKLKFRVAGQTESYSATVYAMEPGVEASSRTLQLRAKAPNTKRALIPGTFASIELPLAQIDDALLIPTEAVIPVQNGKKVFVTEAGKAKEVKIETTARTEKKVLVVAGLKAGDTVLTSGIMSLKPGMPVIVKTGPGK
jgi:membrane fusion protein (multidrug efflux system)